MQYYSLLLLKQDIMHTCFTMVTLVFISYPVFSYCHEFGTKFTAHKYLVGSEADTGTYVACKLLGTLWK